MRLIRLKINEPFRSLQAGFELDFLREWDRLSATGSSGNGFSPYILAGHNGSGKSNVLEVLAAIFYHLECQYIEYRPDSFAYDEESNPKGFRGDKGTPDAFELEYLITLDDAMSLSGGESPAHIRVLKVPNESAQMFWINGAEYSDEKPLSRLQAKTLLPDYVLGYSSGENELLSLPFFKMRFLQLDEYLDFMKKDSSYPGKPESSHIYLDNQYSQAILLCNLLFQNSETLKPFQQEVGIESLEQFRIILKRRIELNKEQANEFPESLIIKEEMDDGELKYYLPILSHLESEVDKSGVFKSTIGRLQRCATCYFHDEADDTLYLDYYVNDETKRAFYNSFVSVLDLFQTFQILLTLNLYSVSESLKKDLYTSDSHYVNETIPTLASDERIMRFKYVKFKTKGVNKSAMLKDLSDGEHQFLHSLGLCMLYKGTKSLFLLDEPETHFNPDWRASYISRLDECFNQVDEASDGPYDDINHELLITTHTPFLISDSKPENVLVFNKNTDTSTVEVKRPDYNTLGASINKITLNTFYKKETIGGYALQKMNVLKHRFEQGKQTDSDNDKQSLISEINRQLGDSVEKVLLIKTILDSMDDEKGGQI